MDLNMLENCKHSNARYIRYNKWANQSAAC